MVQSKNEENRYAVSVADVIERWAAGEVPTQRAITLAGLDDFGELLETAIGSGIPLRRQLLPYEEVQAQRFTELMRSS